MSDDAWDIAPPPFSADTALQTLKRFVRDQHVLDERSEGWMWRGGVVLRLSVEGTAVRVQLARRPARTPEWDAFTLKSATELRKVQDEIQRRLTRWKEHE